MSLSLTDFDRLTRFIQALGQELCCHPPTIYVAVTFAQRFYTKHTFGEFCYLELGAAALLLATKSQENIRPLLLIVGIIARIADVSLYDTPAILENIIISREELLLETLEFDLNVDAPYAHIQTVEEHMAKQVTKFKQFRGIFLSTINDLIHTQLPLKYNTEILCKGCAYFAVSCLTKDLEQIHGNQSRTTEQAKQANQAKQAKQASKASTKLATYWGKKLDQGERFSVIYDLCLELATTCCQDHTKGWYNLTNMLAKKQKYLDGNDLNNETLIEAVK